MQHVHANGLEFAYLEQGDDLRAELMTDQSRYFTGEYRYEEVAGAGHFLQREKPAEVSRLLLEWLGK